jgi:hypothetical protein
MIHLKHLHFTIKVIKTTDPGIKLSIWLYFLIPTYQTPDAQIFIFKLGFLKVNNLNFMYSSMDYI